MTKLNYTIPPLKDNEICGAASYNALLRFAAGYRSLSDFLLLNPDGMGSYTIDLDFAALLAALAQAQSGEELAFDFLCKLEGGDTTTLAVSAGRVFLPFNVVQVLGLTQTLTNADDGKMVYVRMTSISSATLVLDSPVTHTLQTGGNDYRVTLPVALLSLTDGVWRIHYLHLGAFALAHTPYFYISNYRKGESQILGHDANADGAKWITDASDSSSSSSSSSGSDSSSSSSSSSTSDSSSSSSGAAGVLRVTKHNEQEASPITCDGTYTLVSGLATDTSGVWRHSNGDEIYYGAGSWVLNSLTGHFTGEYPMSIAGGADRYDPTTWTGANKASILLAPAFNTYLEIEYIP